MSAKSLQNGGTFRNALTRKIDCVVIPVFADIIIAIDEHCNLDLVASKEVNDARRQFWLSMFRDPKVLRFNYKDSTVGAPIVSQKAGNSFECQLPFSWLVYDVVESQWENAKSSGGELRVTVTAIPTLL